MVVDTSVWIDYFNCNPSWQAERLRSAIADNEPIHLPGIVITEILLGLSNNKEAERVAELLTAFEQPQELTLDDYKQAAEIYSPCRSKGKTIRSTIDCLIAALCLRDNHELLSKDRDFQAIEHCFPLKNITSTH